MRSRRALSVSFALVASLVGGSLSAAPSRSTTYFVAIGSSHYADPPDPGSHGFGRIYGANKSARAVAARLAAGGARYGVLLTSSEGHLVTSADVQSAISSVQERIKSDRAEKPLLILYFAGHGISEGVGWNLFLVPGTMLYPGSLPDRSIEDVAAASLPAATLIQVLDRARLTYVALLDTCYEGKPTSFEIPVLSGPATESLKSVASVLRFMNEFHQSNPVLFSTSPGTMVSTVADPLEPGSDPVAPLARRAMLVLDDAAKAGGQVSVAEFVRRMSAPETDPATGPAITRAIRDPIWGTSMLSYPATPGETSMISGSGAGGVVCCIPRAQPMTTVPTAVGKVRFSGPRGEYVSGGRPLAYDGSLTASQDEASSITFSFRSEDADWELSFAAPGSGALRKGHYARAARYGFAAPGLPSLAVTGDGRACNESDGSFDVEVMDHDATGALTSFAARFEQYCDGSRKPLRGWIGWGRAASAALPR